MFGIRFIGTMLGIRWLGKRFLNTGMANQMITTISIALEKTVCGVPMIEMIAMRICCYILLAVMLYRVLGD